MDLSRNPRSQTHVPKPHVRNLLRDNMLRAEDYAAVVSELQVSSGFLIQAALLTGSESC
jgi:hypothetical protein